jgi:hypothetical protein
MDPSLSRRSYLPSRITYQLTLPYQWKLHDVFHVDLLTLYVETDFHGPKYMMLRVDGTLCST